MKSLYLVERTTALVAAYVSKNHLSSTELPVLIDAVHKVLQDLRAATEFIDGSALAPTFAEIEASITYDRIISFVDGKPYKSLKRHLTAHDLTPERYRARYGLRADYPMVAPSYAARRSQIAKATQLGHKAA